MLENASPEVINALSRAIVKATPGLVCRQLGHFATGHDYFSALEMFLFSQPHVLLDGVLLPLIQVSVRDGPPTGELGFDFMTFVAPLAYLVSSTLLQQLSIFLPYLYFSILALIKDYGLVTTICVACCSTCYLWAPFNRNLRGIYVTFCQINIRVPKYRFFLLFLAGQCL
jgi:hypothetical protein